jgi:hypothetical protein
LDYSDRLRKQDWIVRPVALSVAQELIRQHHYAHGGSNTGTYVHGLFKKDAFWNWDCKGVAWWIPPTKSAALATHPLNWQGVLMLHRLVIVPDTPKNACSFLLSRSMRAIDRTRWPCLVTYADQAQGHTGTIYKATNWTYSGLTAAESIFTLNGRMVSRKAGPTTRTRTEMIALGAHISGTSRKHKFVHTVPKKD